MKKFEYKEETIELKNRTERLTSLSKDGWELVREMDVDNCETKCESLKALLLKREIPENDKKS